jgi:hypothetical protein
MPKYKPRTYTVSEALEAALWCHYCGEHREAKKFLVMLCNYATKEPNNG